MCGVKIMLVFTDMKDNVHYFSNTDEFQVEVSKKFVETGKEKFKFMKYDASEVSI